VSRTALQLQSSSRLLACRAGPARENPAGKVNAVSETHRLGYITRTWVACILPFTLWYFTWTR
jgi:hypothetical protein